MTRRKSVTSSWRLWNPVRTRDSLCVHVVVGGWWSGWVVEWVGGGGGIILNETLKSVLVWECDSGEWSGNVTQERTYLWSLVTELITSNMTDQLDCSVCPLERST